MSLLRMLLRSRTRAMDPLQVSMTGVRMGERFLQIGCHDRALLSGLAAKVGLSGTAAVAAFDDAEAKRAGGVGAKVGALIETHKIEGRALPFDSDQFDMVVVDDTNGRFAAIADDVRADYLREAKRTVRRGGRIEIIEGIEAKRPQSLRRVARSRSGGVQTGAAARRARRVPIYRRTGHRPDSSD